MTHLLLPLVEKGDLSKGLSTIVTLSSIAHHGTYEEGVRLDLSRINSAKEYNDDKSYGESKLANILFAQELATRVKSKGILVNVVHPGAVVTELVRHFPEETQRFLNKYFTPLMFDSDTGCLTQVFSAVSPILLKKQTTGKYFVPIAAEDKPSAKAQDKKLQQDLWNFTEDVLRLKASFEGLSV